MDSRNLDGREKFVVGSKVVCRGGLSGHEKGFNLIITILFVIRFLSP